MSKLQGNLRLLILDIMKNWEVPNSKFYESISSEYEPKLSIKEKKDWNDWISSIILTSTETELLLFDLLKSDKSIDIGVKAIIKGKVPLFEDISDKSFILEIETIYQNNFKIILGPSILEFTTIKGNEFTVFMCLDVKKMKNAHLRYIEGHPLLIHQSYEEKVRSNDSDLKNMWRDLDD